MSRDDERYLYIKSMITVLRMIAPRDLPLYYPNPAIYTLGKKEGKKRKEKHACSLSNRGRAITTNEKKKTITTEREERKEKRN